MVSLSIPFLVLLHLYISPYTKVEESFNIQATHDILTYGIPSKNIQDAFSQQYDHVSFPGSVPRTFIGALVLSGLARPWTGFLASTMQLQYLVRAILGLTNALALLRFRKAVDTVFGRIAANWYVLLQASQFHVVYYASRTLPNMFAFALSTFALAELLLTTGVNTKKGVKHARLALYLLTIAAIVFRSELALLLLAQTAHFVVAGRISLRYVVIPAGILGAVVGLSATLLLDSFFWQSFPLWPEWSGFYYNTILGKSSEWGVSPWYFYYLIAIPRLLMNPMTYLVCIPLAVRTPATRRQVHHILIPIVYFVSAYSLLPHKEWRFIIYVVPSLTAVAAVGAAWIWNRRTRSMTYRILSLALVASTIASLFLSLGMLYVSSLNYPGGTALHRLHELAEGSKGVISVHLDNLSTQTGVTRMVELPGRSLSDPEGRTSWFYDKTENQTELLRPSFWRRFDYVLAERPEKVIGEWEVVEVVNGYAGIGLVKEEDNQTQSHGHRQRLWQMWYNIETILRSKLTRGYWPKLRMEPKVNILKRQRPTAADYPGLFNKKRRTRG